MADACVGETCVPAANGDDAAADAQSSDGPATDLVASADQSEDVPGPAADGPSEVGQPIDAAIDVPSPDVGVPPDGAPALRANGEACSAAGQCRSNFCTDAVCCNAACSGQCQTCNGPGTPGVCLPISGAPQGGRPACAGAGGTCGGVCNGTVGAACTYPSAAVTCGAPSCSNGIAQPTPTCNGVGACIMPPTVSCAPYPCAQNVCAGGCSDSNPCSGENYCAAGKCVPKLARGSACARADQCTDGQCTDGVCCDRACGGDCEACNIAGSVGTCKYQQGTVCRDSRGDCDPAEVCAGNASDCPADRLQNSSVVCRGPQGSCDVPEFCTGSSVSCPAPGPILACDAGAPPVDTRPPADTAAPPVDTAPPPVDTAPACPSDVIEVNWDPTNYPGGFGTVPSSPVAAWNGAGYGQAWHSESNGSTFQTIVNRLDTSGVEVAGSRAVASTTSFGSGPSAIAFSGSGYGVVYSHGTTPSQIFFRPLNASGVPTGSESMVSEAPMPGTFGQNTASIAWGTGNGGEWGVIWNGFDGNNSVVMFRRVSAAGAALASSTAVGPGGSGMEYAGGPLILWNGTSYVTTWEEGGGVRVAFITKDGAFSSKGAGIATSRDASIAYRTGVEYGLVWIETSGSFENWVLAFGRADTAGNLINGSRVPLNTAGTFPQYGGVAWTGTNWVVTWSEGPVSGMPRHIWTARIDVNGALVPGSRRAVTCANSRDTSPYLVWGGGKAAVTFMRNDAEGRMVIFP
jgi:hypothetical protein